MIVPEGFSQRPRLERTTAISWLDMVSLRSKGEDNQKSSGSVIGLMMVGKYGPMKLIDLDLIYQDVIQCLMRIQI